MKKQEFLLPVARLFTRGQDDVYEAIQFQHSESFGDETLPALMAPATWSAEAVAMVAEAACPAHPAELHAVEENTVPSWLWRHTGRGSSRAAEGDVRQIFDRAVGSATAVGWKLNLFSSEKHARAFYDEARFALIQRHIAFAPEIMRGWGLSWAYNLPQTQRVAMPRSESATELSNATIDTLLSKSKTAPSALLKKLFTLRGKQKTSVTLRLSDIANDWHSTGSNPARAAIDLMALRHNDGGINIEALRQAARLATLVLDLQDSADVTIGLANLAPLLLALGLAYDSEAGRALAASIAALVTAECYAASAEMAALRGPSVAFTNEREAVMRSLRNHRRAAYGDGNDYEKLSVLPAPLPLKNCPDLALAAAAQHRWDQTLELARGFGLRATQVTDLTPSPLLAMQMQSASQGLEPLRALTVLTPDANDVYRAELHPAVVEALTRLNYPRNTLQAITQHIAGARSLTKAPSINHTSLRVCGINDVAFEKIESYLPCVNSVRLACTPWIVGVDYCRNILKIPTRALQSPRFDLLKHLGFNDADIAAADLFCYGHGTARSAKALQLRHRQLFACGSEISTEARIRMAAALQSFVSGDTGIATDIPAAQGVARGVEITLAAWRCGLKSLTIDLDPALAAAPARKTAKTARRIKAAAQSHAKPMNATRRAAHRGGKTPTTLSAKKDALRAKAVNQID